MWTDALAWIWPALPWLFAAGCCFILAGAAGIVVFRRREVTLGPDPVIPPVQQPRPFSVPSAPAPANYRRPDSDTGVVPRIPSATPVLSPQLAAVARYLDDIDRADQTVEIVTAWEAAEPVEGLRVIPSTELWPEEPNDSTEEQFDPGPADECALTTGEIEIPTDGAPPLYRSLAGREPTQEMTVPLAKILEASK